MTKVTNSIPPKNSTIDSKATPPSQNADSFQSVLHKLSFQNSSTNGAMKNLAKDLSTGSITKEEAVAAFVNIIIDDMQLPAHAPTMQMQNAVSGILNTEPHFADRLERYLLKNVA